MTAIIWWEWFRQSDGQEVRREVMLVNLPSCPMVIAIVRALSDWLPYRERPMHAMLGFHLPFTTDRAWLQSWSSFPSDHAVLFFHVSMGLWLAHRRMGVAAFAYTTIIICLLRLYTGMHYPTDLLVGALIGIGSAALSELVVRRRWRGRWFSFWWSRNQPALYAGLFFVTYQIASFFESFREFGSMVLRLLLGSSK